MNYLFIGFHSIREGLGTGHIVRLKNIINSLDSFRKKRESKCFFITNDDEYSEQYQLKQVDNFQDTSQAAKELLKEETIDVVVFDCLDYCQDLYEKCKDENLFTLGIDTSLEASKKLDLLINPVISNNFSFLEGPMYSLHYEDQCPQEKAVLSQSKSIFVCFGGIDYRGHLKKLLPLLSSISKSCTFNVVTSNDEQVINSMTLPENVNIHHRPLNFFDLLKQSSLAIISGGVLFQEAMYLGVPSYVIPQYDHQSENAKQKIDKGLALAVSSISPDYEYICNEVKNMLVQTELLRSISIKSCAADDGFGLRRLNHILKVYEHLRWDSEFFDKKIYSLNTKCYKSSIKKMLDNLLKVKKIDLIYFLCPSEDRQSINLALSDGFFKVDERVTYLVDGTTFDRVSYEEKIVIRRSSLEDSKNLSSLAAQTEWTTRYVNDPNFPKKKIQEFYSEWIKKSIVGDLDDMVFHLEDEGCILGFVSIRKNGLNSGSIGLIAVAKEGQGKGYGKALAAYAVDYMLSALNCASVDVVTQETNVNACKTYEKIGFRVSEHSTWLHRWV